ncbi:DUF397 domain-containing protein [Streptomyces sp. NPDC054887]
MTRKPAVGDVAELEWFKSSYSTNDGPECVEVAWTKSSYSGSDTNHCVETATGCGIVHVRDSKNVRGPRLGFAPGAWADFVAYASTS